MTQERHTVRDLCNDPALPGVKPAVDVFIKNYKKITGEDINIDEEYTQDFYFERDILNRNANIIKCGDESCEIIGRIEDFETRRDEKLIFNKEYGGKKHILYIDYYNAISFITLNAKNNDKLATSTGMWKANDTHVNSALKSFLGEGIRDGLKHKL